VPIGFHTAYFVLWNPSVNNPKIPMGMYWNSISLIVLSSGSWRTYQTGSWSTRDPRESVGVFQDSTYETGFDVHCIRASCHCFRSAVFVFLVSFIHKIRKWCVESFVETVSSSTLVWDHYDPTTTCYCHEGAARNIRMEIPSNYAFSGRITLRKLLTLVVSFCYNWKNAY
jgi:hypothetical protein